MTDEQAQRVIEMWVGCHDVADIAANTGLTQFEVRAEINRVDPPDRGQTFLIPPATRAPKQCRDCLAPVPYAGTGRPAERCDIHRHKNRRNKA